MLYTQIYTTSSWLTSSLLLGCDVCVIVIYQIMWPCTGPLNLVISVGVIGERDAPLQN
jgi:hypothetical protein